MFDISFGELLLICVVALVVLGPERLPSVARTLGALVARAQRFVASVKADIGQQTDLAGLAALKNEVRGTAYALKEQLVAELEQAQSVAQSARAEVSALAAESLAANSAAAPEPAAPPPPVAEPAVELPAAAAVEAPAAAPLAAAVPQPVAAAATPVIDENQLDLFADLPPTDTSRETTR